MVTQPGRVGWLSRARWATAAFTIYLNIIQGPIILNSFDCCCQDCLATLPYPLGVAPPSYNLVVVEQA